MAARVAPSPLAKMSSPLRRLMTVLWEALVWLAWALEVMASAKSEIARLTGKPCVEFDA